MSDVDRRTFLGVTTTVAAAMFIKPALVRGTNANSAIRVGLLGCGGRGTEDASNLVDTGGARVVALADLFQDQLDAAHAHFDQLQQAKGYAALDPKQLFVGPRAYEQIAASKEVDAMVIATPPYFHLQPRSSFTGAGIWMPPRPLLGKLRDAIAEDPRGFERVVKNQGFVRRFGGLDDEHTLKRMPRGFAETHAAARWLKFQSFVAGRELRDNQVTSPRLATLLQDDFSRLLPLVRWLNGALGLKAAATR